MDSKNISIEKTVTLLNAVISMETIALGNEICFQFSLHENQFFIELISGKLSRTCNYINLNFLLSIVKDVLCTCLGCDIPY